MTLCRVWPGITPMNVWDMRYRDWLTFAAAVDAVEAQQSKGSGVIRV